MNDPIGIDVDKVSRWLSDNIDGATAPFAFDLLAGGHSNLTFRVVDANGSAYVLRRPPLGHLLASAHDMGREYRIIAALGNTAVPVPAAHGHCDDIEVNGAPFYVMGLIDGLVIRTLDDAAHLLDAAGRRRAGEELVDTLAVLHDVDPDAVGLGGLGKKEDYIARQLKRWHGQWEQSKTRELPAVDDTFDILVSRIPTQQGASIVHGDYRLENSMVSREGELLAVIDWEICTLGDPLADLGLLYVYWSIDNGDDEAALPQAPTLLDGFPSVDEVIARYAARSSRDLSDLDYYIAFGYWKLACIVEGVYNRYLSGARGERDPATLVGFANQVELCARLGAEFAGKLR
ncbi:MAG: phosphotransferase family protein [Acidimicrobiia bacterium]